MASVKFDWAGAAPLATPTQVAFQKLLPPDANFTQMFGMTELTCIGTMLHWPENDSTVVWGDLFPGSKSSWSTTKATKSTITILMESFISAAQQSSLANLKTPKQTLQRSIRTDGSSQATLAIVTKNLSCGI